MARITGTAGAGTYIPPASSVALVSMRVMVECVGYPTDTPLPITIESYQDGIALMCPRSFVTNFVYTAMSLVVIGFMVFLGCDEGPSQPQTGFISVTVTDNNPSQLPVEGVKIEIAPIHLVLTTNEDGLAVFEVAPGDYFVDAQVCCVGPGWIDYHVPVTVTAGETFEVELKACLSCV